jgi:hypothetical protein
MSVICPAESAARTGAVLEPADGFRPILEESLESCGAVLLP